VTTTPARVIEIVASHSGVPTAKLNARSAIDQDVQIAGGDFIELAETLAAEFSEQVLRWPWHRFATLDEGLSLFALPMLLWQLVSWPIRGSFSYPSPFERLELGHIAAAIDRGEWFDP
jgi:hypothetical protein